MKKIGLGLLYFFLFTLFVVIFTPKEYLYYKIEHLLKESYAVVISNESVEEGFFDVEAKDGWLFVKDIEVGSIKRVSIYPDIWINALILEGFNTNKNISLLPNLHIKRVMLFYTPFFPIKIFIKGDSSVGKMEGFIDIKDKKGSIDIFGYPKNLNQFIRFKKIKKGHYRYEFKF